MDPFFFHPRLVHVPLGLAVALPFLGLAVLLASRRNWLPLRTWGLVVLLQIVATTSGVVAMRAGENEEALVEEGVPEEALERHEEAAEQFVWMTAGSAALGAGGWLLQAAPVGPWLALASVAGTGVALGLGIRAGASGGDLVYRHGAAEVRRQSGSAGRQDSPGRDDRR